MLLDIEPIFKKLNKIKERLNSLRKERDDLENEVRELKVENYILKCRLEELEENSEKESLQINEDVL